MLILSYRLFLLDNSLQLFLVGSWWGALWSGLAEITCSGRSRQRDGGWPSEERKSVTRPINNMGSYGYFQVHLNRTDWTGRSKVMLRSRRWRAESSFWWSPDTLTCSARFGVLPVCGNSPIYFAVLSWGSVSVPEMPTDSQGQKHHWPKFGGVWVNEGQKVTEQTWTSHLPCSTPHLWGRLHYRYYLCYIFFINVLLTLMCINVLTLP